MANNSKIDLLSWTAIILGLVIGFMLKKAKVGIIVGLVLGVIIVYLVNKSRLKK